MDPATQSFLPLFLSTSNSLLSSFRWNYWAGAAVLAYAWAPGSWYLKAGRCSCLCQAVLVVTMVIRPSFLPAFLAFILWYHVLFSFLVVCLDPSLKIGLPGYPFTESVCTNLFLLFPAKEITYLFSTCLPTLQLSHILACQSCSLLLPLFRKQQVSQKKKHFKFSNFLFYSSWQNS